jgi:hypothetical protein
MKCKLLHTTFVGMYINFEVGVADLGIVLVPIWLTLMRSAEANYGLYWMEAQLQD